MAVIIAIVIFGGLLALGIILFKKMNKPMKTGGIIGGILGLIGAAVFMVMPTRAYIVTGESECSEYVVFGSSDYEMSNGESVTIKAPFAQCFVVNDSEEPVIIEEVVYGTSSTNFGWMKIDGMSGEVVDCASIGYLFVEPPDEIETESSGETKRWLRRANEYDFLFDMDESDFDDLMDESELENLEDMLNEEENEEEYEEG